MSNNANAVQDCCICLEPAENGVVTPCNPETLCEACYQKVPSCLLCRAPFDNGVPLRGFC